MVVRGVQMWSGLERDHSARGPLSRVSRLCGLTLGGGVEEDLESPPARTEARKASGNPGGLRLIVSNRQGGHDRLL